MCSFIFRFLLSDESVPVCPYFSQSQTVSETKGLFTTETIGIRPELSGGTDIDANGPLCVSSRDRNLDNLRGYVGPQNEVVHVSIGLKSCMRLRDKCSGFAIWNFTSAVSESGFLHQLYQNLEFCIQLHQTIMTR